MVNDSNQKIDVALRYIERGRLAHVVQTVVALVGIGVASFAPYSIYVFPVAVSLTLVGWLYVDYQFSEAVERIDLYQKAAQFAELVAQWSGDK
jgi:hypothetical protein